MMGVSRELTDKICKVVSTQNQVDVVFSHLLPIHCPPFPPPPLLHRDLLPPPTPLDLGQENSSGAKVDRGVSV